LAYLFSLVVDPAITLSPVLTPILPFAEEIHLLNTYRILSSGSPLARLDSSQSVSLGSSAYLSYLNDKYNSFILISGCTCLFLYIAPLNAERRPQLCCACSVSSDPSDSSPFAPAIAQSDERIPSFRRWWLFTPLIIDMCTPLYTFWHNSCH
jgi:hypothetical protein